MFIPIRVYIKGNHIMFSLNLLNKDNSINQSVLRFILENEDEEFIDHLIPDPIGYTVKQTENGNLYHIELTEKLWVDLLQNGNDYSLVGCS